ncbi:MAG: hypothetical protein C0507_08470 [Cyanobacteria bacterium PR.3.49]|nr:hypothetical protein [Cyanobacteria bacterium PR.3.49]
MNFLNSQERVVIQIQDLYIDLERAAETKHADYMFPLMRAMNDCMLMTKYGECDSVLKDIHLTDFLHRLGQAAMHEALLSFVANIVPQNAGTPKPIFVYLSTKPNVAAAFRKVRVHTENAEMMKCFKDVRDKMMFHYDVQESYTRKTLVALSKLAKGNPSISTGGPLIRSASDAAFARHFCADIFNNVGWSQIHNQVRTSEDDSSIVTSIRPSPGYQESFVRFFADAMKDFYSFAATALIEWLEEHQLVTKFDIYSLEEEESPN